MRDADKRLSRERYSVSDILAAAAFLAECDVMDLRRQSSAGPAGSSSRVACNLKFAAVHLCYMIQHVEAEIYQGFGYSSRQGAKYALKAAKDRMTSGGQVGEQFRREQLRLARYLNENRTAGNNPGRASAEIKGMETA